MITLRASSVRKRLIFGVSAALSAAAVLALLSRLNPSAPLVENPWIDTVKRGSLKRQVRGLGVLVPTQTQYVQAGAGGRVERIFVLPGAEIDADTVLLELTNPDLEQSAVEAGQEVRSAETRLATLKARLESEQVAQEALLTTLRAKIQAAEVLDASTNPDSSPAPQESPATAVDLNARMTIEAQRLELAAESAKAELAIQQAQIERLRALRDLRQSQVEALRVRAGIKGILTQLGDGETLQLGQRVPPGATLAKVMASPLLKAEIRIPETQARDLDLGQPAEIDTRDGVMTGRVVRVDPTVQNETVLVEVHLEGDLPRGARPGLSVEGTIELERVENTVLVGRPVQGQADSTVELFRLLPNGRGAVRVPVRLGRSSASAVEILEGLQVNDRVILSDMSPWEGHERVKLRTPREVQGI